MYWKAFLFLTILLQQQTCAQINLSSRPCAARQSRIVGGQEALSNEMPYMVSLTRRGGHFCGATIIHDRWLLTAAHCLCNGLNQFLKPAHLQGVLGLHNVTAHYQNIAGGQQQSSAAVTMNIKHVVPHPNYKCTKTENDIALLEVIKPIEFTAHIQPSCLAVEGGVSVLEHDIATVSGWGWTHENQELGERPHTLRKAAVQIWSNKICQKSYRTHSDVDHLIIDTQMCAGFKKGGIDSCWADSGGPLVTHNNILIGVVSTGIGCARPGLPGIYTRVSKFMPWIESVIATTTTTI